MYIHILSLNSLKIQLVVRKIDKEFENNRKELYILTSKREKRYK